MENEQLGFPFERGTSVIVELPQQPVNGNLASIRGVDQARVPVRQHNDDAHVGTAMVREAGELVDLTDELVVLQVATDGHLRVGTEKENGQIFFF